MPTKYIEYPVGMDFGGVQSGIEYLAPSIGG